MIDIRIYSVDNVILFITRGAGRTATPRLWTDVLVICTTEYLHTIKQSSSSLYAAINQSIERSISNNTVRQFYLSTRLRFTYTA